MMPVSTVAAPTSLVGATTDNLVAGLRLASARAVRRDQFHSSPAQLTTAVVGLWLAVVLFSKLSAGAASQFWIWGLSAFAAQLYLWLTLVTVIAALLGQARHSVALIIILIYAQAPVAAVAGITAAFGSALQLTPSPAGIELYQKAVLAWYVLVFARALRLQLAPPTIRLICAVLSYAAILIWSLAALPRAEMFYRPITDPTSALDVESIYYQQHELVDHQLDALAAQSPAAIDLYFLAHAAYSAEDVFMREALSTRTQAERKLGAAGRSAVLINNRATVAALPLANRANLARTLKGIGDIIDREQDIVFLFMTSHGHDDASLAAEFENLMPNDLYAEDVRAALDAAAIRWRVVVVSACYSGSFIDILRSPTTLVITASAADRVSFGCSHENQWTYFGRAYFNEALARTRDPVAAFAIARDLIRERERQEGKRPSRPQIDLGEDMAVHLRSWLAEPLAAQSSDSTQSR